MTSSKWWANIRNGLFVDENGKHYKRMGEAIWLYGYLHMAADWQTGKLIRKYKTIMNDTGHKKRTLVRWMATLKKYGYIKVIPLSNSMAIEITKWRPISNATNGDSKKEEGHIWPGGTPHLTNNATYGDPLSDSKQTSEKISIATYGDPIISPLSKPKDIYRIFDFWNKQNIKNHREINKFEKCINARLEFYKAEEIIQAIKNYKDILVSDNHFFTYEWTLKQFLNQTNGLDNFIDREKASKNYWNIRNGSEYQEGALDGDACPSDNKDREERIKKGREKYQKEMKG